MRLNNIVYMRSIGDYYPLLPSQDVNNHGKFKLNRYGNLYV